MLPAEKVAARHEKASGGVSRRIQLASCAPTLSISAWAILCVIPGASRAIRLRGVLLRFVRQSEAKNASAASTGTHESICTPTNVPPKLRGTMPTTVNARPFK